MGSFKQAQLDFFDESAVIMEECCSGLAAKASTFHWSDGRWHADSCPKYADHSSTGYVAKVLNRCDCGAASTSNPNCHSTWCSEYKK